MHIDKYALSQTGLYLICLERYYEISQRGVGSEVFEGMEYLLETLLGGKVSKSDPAMGGWGVSDCFGHVLVVSHVAEY